MMRKLKLRKLTDETLEGANATLYDVKDGSIVVIGVPQFATMNDYEQAIGIAESLRGAHPATSFVVLPDGHTFEVFEAE